VSSSKKLGDVLWRARRAKGWTQRELAEKLAVKPSHVTQIETGRRGPSLALLARLSRELDLDSQELFLMAHPEAKELLSPEPRNTSPPNPREGWRLLTSNRALLRRYAVTPRELKALKQLSLLGHVLTPREFLAILTLIRETPGS